MPVIDSYSYPKKPCSLKTADALSLPLRAALNGKKVSMIDGKKESRSFSASKRALYIALLILFAPLLIISAFSLLAKKICIKSPLPPELQEKTPEKPQPPTEEQTDPNKKNEAETPKETKETTNTEELPTLKNDFVKKTGEQPQTQKQAVSAPSVSTPTANQGEPQKNQETNPIVKTFQAFLSESKQTNKGKTDFNKDVFEVQLHSFFDHITQSYTPTPSPSPTTPPPAIPTPTPTGGNQTPATPSPLPPRETATPAATSSTPQPPQPSTPASPPTENLSEGLPPPSSDILTIMQKAAGSIDDKEKTKTPLNQFYTAFHNAVDALSLHDQLQVLKQLLEEQTKVHAFLTEFKEKRKLKPFDPKNDTQALNISVKAIFGRLAERLADEPKTGISAYQLIQHPKLGDFNTDPKPLQEKFLAKIKEQILAKNLPLFQALFDQQKCHINAKALLSIVIEMLDKEASLDTETINAWCSKWQVLGLPSYYEALHCLKRIAIIVARDDLALPELTQEFKKCATFLQQIPADSPFLEREPLKQTNSLAGKLVDKAEKLINEGKGESITEITQLAPYYEKVREILKWEPTLKMESNTIFDGKITFNWDYFHKEEEKKAAENTLLEAAAKAAAGLPYDDFKQKYKDKGGDIKDFDAIKVPEKPVTPPPPPPPTPTPTPTPPPPQEGEIDDELEITPDED
jgi:hypothetical protein